MAVVSESPALALGFAHLSRSERLVFDFLYGALGNWFTSDELKRRTIGAYNTGLKTHICHMRSKLYGSDFEIQSLSGAYRLVKKT